MHAGNENIYGAVAGRENTSWDVCVCVCALRGWRRVNAEVRVGVHLHGRVLTNGACV